MSEEAHRCFKQKAATTGKTIIQVIDEAAGKESNDEKKKLKKDWGKLF